MIRFFLSLLSLFYAYQAAAYETIVLIGDSQLHSVHPERTQEGTVVDLFGQNGQDAHQIARNGMTANDAVDQNVWDSVSSLVNKRESVAIILELMINDWRHSSINEFRRNYRRLLDGLNDIDNADVFCMPSVGWWPGSSVGSFFAYNAYGEPVSDYVRVVIRNAVRGKCELMPTYIWPFFKGDSTPNGHMTSSGHRRTYEYIRWQLSW